MLKLGARFYLRSSVKWVTTPHDASLSSRIQGNEQCCREKKSLKLTPSLRPNIGRTRPVSCEMDTQKPVKDLFSSGRAVLIFSF